MVTEQENKQDHFVNLISQHKLMKSNSIHLHLKMYLSFFLTEVRAQLQSSNTGAGKASVISAQAHLHRADKSCLSWNPVTVVHVPAATHKSLTV